jgi:hypothetical protein
MALKLTEAKKWVLSVRNCISRIDEFLLCKHKFSEKVKYAEIEKLVAARCKSFCEPGLPQLQVCKTRQYYTLYRRTLKFTLF